MWFIVFLSYLAIIVQIGFATVGIAAGLYYLAELVEEYSATAKKCIWWTNLVTTFLFLGMWLFEDLPFLMVACGLVSQFCHFVILQNFPFVRLTSPTFILGVIFIFVNHYFAFQHFASYYHTFSEVMSYFTLCLWLVPFSLFVSLSANENVLPTTAERRPLLGDDDVVTNYFSKKGKRYGLLSLFNYVKEIIVPQRHKKGF